jgi:hypothetical protein
MASSKCGSAKATALKNKKNAPQVKDIFFIIIPFILTSKCKGFEKTWLF